MNILYIDVDSLRPDHLGCYGYFRNTSPNIDKIAERGVRFTNYYASDTPLLLHARHFLQANLVSIMAS